MNSLTDFIVVLSVLLGVSSAAPQTRLSTTIGDYHYFSDDTQTRSRADALIYCTQEDGELAKIWNEIMFRNLRTAVRVPGAYWIDGIDRPDESRFQLNSTCSFRGERLNFRNMAASNVDIPSISCLSLQRATSATSSKIVVANCNETKFVLCQRPLSGCQEGGTNSPAPVQPTRGTTTVSPTQSTRGTTTTSPTQSTRGTTTTSPTQSIFSSTITFSSSSTEGPTIVA